MNSTPSDQPAFRAWWRASRRDGWQELATGKTEEEAFNGLLDALTERRGGDSLVLSADRRPSDTANQRYVVGVEREELTR